MTKFQQTALKERLLRELPSTEEFTAEQASKRLNCSYRLVRDAFSELADEQRVYTRQQPKTQAKLYRVPAPRKRRRAPLTTAHEDVRTLVAQAGRVTRGRLITHAAAHIRKPAKDIEKLIDDLCHAGVLKLKIVGVTSVISLEAA